MIVVRYAALAALVAWLASMLDLQAAEAVRGTWVPLACGGVVLISLVVMKFVGPPPRAFFLRAGIVALMLVIALLVSIGRVPGTIAVPVNLGLAAILLFWYVIE